MGKSSFDMVRLLLKYDILDDVYREDIVLFEKGKGKTILHTIG